MKFNQTHCEKEREMIQKWESWGMRHLWAANSIYQPLLGGQKPGHEPQRFQTDINLGASKVEIPLISLHKGISPTRGRLFPDAIWPKSCKNRSCPLALEAMAITLTQHHNHWLTSFQRTVRLSERKKKSDSSQLISASSLVNKSQGRNTGSGLKKKKVEIEVARPPLEASGCSFCVRKSSAK